MGRTGEYCSRKTPGAEAVISHGAADSDPRWYEVLACHVSKNDKYVSIFFLCCLNCIVDRKVAISRVVICYNSKKLNIPIAYGTV